MIFGFSRKITRISFLLERCCHCHHRQTQRQKHIFLVGQVCNWYGKRNLKRNIIKTFKITLQAQVANYSDGVESAVLINVCACNADIPTSFSYLIIHVITIESIEWIRMCLSSVFGVISKVLECLIMTQRSHTGDGSLKSIFEARHLNLRKNAIWMSKNCQKLDIFPKNWQKLSFFQ